MSFDSPTPNFDLRKAEIIRAFDASDWLRLAIRFARETLILLARDGRSGDFVECRFLKR